MAHDVALTPGSALAALREMHPLVHCITNRIANTLTANILLAVGASPCMADVPGEAERLTPSAGGLLINVASASGDRARASLRSVRAAEEAGVRWVLDPVGAGTIANDDLVDALVRLHPTVLRGNPSEILALDGRPHGGRGVDATDLPDAAARAATRLALQDGCAVAVSGPEDLLTDGERTVRVRNGTDLLPLVTGSGCALGGLMAAFLSLPFSALEAAVAATALLTVAGERAAARSAGPGSFAVQLLDELHAVTPDQLDEEVHLA
ncbi:MAG: hydroxyethylthiazole kinase [Microbacteriaceae bacterium]|nr:hydroxyethylthiazole kinase [Microbacteriaceae bacterium]MCI1207323.1 hydroxyethylthiazole kinase [Microbacteriaceae bacterium]